MLRANRVAAAGRLPGPGNLSMICSGNDPRERKLIDEMHRAQNTRFALLVLMTGLLGCGHEMAASARDVNDANDTGRTLQAKTAAERAILAELPRLPTDSPRQLSGLTVLAHAPYSAASGRTCRILSLRQPTRQAHERLACSDGSAWFFVPDVFGTGATEE